MREWPRGSPLVLAVENLFKQMAVAFPARCSCRQLAQQVVRSEVLLGPMSDGEDDHGLGSDHKQGSARFLFAHAVEQLVHGKRERRTFVGQWESRGVMSEFVQHVGPPVEPRSGQALWRDFFTRSPSREPFRSISDSESQAAACCQLATCRRDPLQRQTMLATRRWRLSRAANLAGE